MRIVTIALAVVLGASCGGGGYQANRKVAERQWIELRTPRFVVHTDMDRETALARTIDLDNATWALGETYSALLGRPTAPGDVTNALLYASCSDGAIDDKHSGFVTTAPDYTGARYIVTCGTDKWAQQALLHELTHIFNRSTFGSMPIWLNEGLADYLSSVEVDGNRVVIGRPSRLQGQFFGRAATLPTLEVLTTADYKRFHFGAQEGTYYFAASSLVRVLSTRSEAGLQQFVRYMRQVAATGDARKAWRASFSAGDIDDIQDRLQTATSLTSVKSWSAPHRPPPDFAAPLVRTLRPSEIHVDWVQVQLMSRPGKDPAPLLAHIDAAEAGDPSFTDGDFWRARVVGVTTQGKDPRILPLYRAQAGRHPTDERVLHAILSHALTEAEGDEDQVIDEARLSGLASYVPDAMSLAKNAETSGSFNTLGWFFALLRKPDVGLGFARRSVELEPTCAVCLDTLALLLAEKGQTDEALALQERAVSMLGDLPASSGMLKRLEALRKAAGH